MPTAPIRNIDDLDIGGYVLSKPLREQALASPDPDIQALADLKGTLPNTAGRTDDAAVGLAYVDGGLNIGLSYNHHDARYGVPIRYSLDPAIEAEVADHRRAPGPRRHARVNVPIGGGCLDLFEFRGGISKYHHDELEKDGSVGSSFFSNGGEMRADVVQASRGGWGGTTGVQIWIRTREFAATRNICRTAPTSSSGCSPCSRWSAGRCDWKAGFASSSPTSTPTRTKRSRSRATSLG